MTQAGCRDSTPVEHLRGKTVADAMVRRPKVFGSGATAAQIRELFHDDHVHAALIIDRSRRLAAVVERADLDDSDETNAPASALGRLDGRTVAPDADLVDVWRAMRDHCRRRLAVVDSAGRLLGLLCLKRSGLGFCSDADVSARRLEREAGSRVA